MRLTLLRDLSVIVFLLGAATAVVLSMGHSRAPSLSSSSSLPTIAPPSGQLTTKAIQQQSLPVKDVRDEVLTHDTRLAAKGYNLFTSESRPNIYLIDMNGRHVHRWSFKESDLLKDHERFRNIVFFHVEPLADGNLIAVVTDQALMKIDWNGNVQWKILGKFHHDVAVSEDGRIYALSRGPHFVKAHGTEGYILDDYVTVISAEGDVEKKISLFHGIRDVFDRATLEQAAEYSKMKRAQKKRLLNDSPADLMHTNSIELVRTPIPGVAKQGDLLLSTREKSLVYTLDPTTKKVRWRLQYPTDSQHDATFLDNNHLLVFDNGRYRGYSEAVEIIPATHRVVWRFGKEQKQFFSPYRGGAQRLPNGNTLITHRESGEVFETTKSGEIVWHYKKYKNNYDDHYIYRMHRIPDGSPFLERLQ